MFKFRFRYFLFCFCIMFLYFGMIGIAAAAPYYSYIYDFWENPVPAPKPYFPEAIVSGPDLGIDEFDNPQDIHVCQNNNIYIVDSGNNRIIMMNQEMELKKIYDSFLNDNSQDIFNNPNGVFTINNLMYVADTGNNRIVVLNINNNGLEKILGPPETDVEGLIPKDFVFRPLKIGITSDQRIYVISRGVYDGLMQFTPEGAFLGYVGAPRVSPDPIDYLWSQIATQEQRRRMSLYLPIQYSNLDIDDIGFVYATALEVENAIKKINPAGVDILRREGFHPPMGDYGSTLEDDEGNLIFPPSRFIDIVAREYGIYSALDSNRGRVFTYDHNGNLLYVFGMRGNQKGLFELPRAIEVLDKKIIVLDSRANQITVFSPTNYARYIHQGIEFFRNGLYDDSRIMWENVLRKNVNFDMAYTGIGRAYLYTDNHEESLFYFRNGQNRKDYSRALERYRSELILDNFTLIIYIIISILFLLTIVLKFKLFMLIENKLEKLTAISSSDHKLQNKAPKRYLNKLYRIVKSLFFSLKLIFHPVGGFWDLKQEKKGGIISAIIILIMVNLTYIWVRQYTGFIFNPRDLRDLNIIIEFISVLLPFGLWCLVSWSLTTLMEGKGSPGEIFTATSYGLVPLIVINLPVIILSHGFTLQESPFYYLFISTAILWSGLLIFTGTMVIHDYDVSKTIFTIIGTIMGIGFVLFIGLLVFSIYTQITSFIYDIYIEVILRL